MRRIVKLLLAGLTAVCSNEVKAQTDPHFSQYYVYPAYLNPALTGAFDGDYRISGIYRTQWGNISTPFSTPGLSAEFTTAKNSNFGLSLMNQTAGDGGFNYLTAYGSYSYTGVRFGANEQHRIALGMQLGIISRRFNPSKISFGDMWNIMTGKPDLPSSETFSRTSAVAFDAGAGILYFDAQPGKKANAFGGISVAHINRPDDKFTETGDARIPVRYTMHGGVRLVLNETLSLTPNLLYMRQGKAEEKMAGAYLQMKVDPAQEVNVMLGANYRFKDAVSPYAGFTWKNMALGVSYDVNTSDLGKMAKGSNSFEISLSFTSKKTAKTPEVEFVCPRL